MEVRDKDEDVKVLGFWASPFSLRVCIALELKGLSFEYLEEDFANKTQLLLQSNPVHKKVPVLIHNGKPIAESLVIIEYIDEKWIQVTLLPRDPYNRAVARFWAAFIDSQLRCSLGKVIRFQGEKQEKAKEEAARVCAFIEEALSCSFGGKPFFGGERAGFVDLVLGSFVSSFSIIEKIRGIKLLNPDSILGWSAS
eukprot:Gb_37875 [translate_table: standard]